MIETFVILGASGDLSGRLLLPALAELHAAGGLGNDFRVVGAGRHAWTTDQFVEHARRWLSENAPSLPAAGRNALEAVLRYRQVDVTDARAVAAVLDLASAESNAGSGPVAVYLALPSQLMVSAVRALSDYGMPAGSRVAVEKPFGHDAESASELNLALADIDASAVQASIYRVDHALAMTAVQDLPGMCFPGTSQPIEWGSRQIEQVDVLWEETLALEGRASFYDRSGALRDVMQNHLLQVLCAVAQPPPATNAGLAAPDRSEGRASVLRSVRPLGKTDVALHTRRARYAAGRLAHSGGADGRIVPDYTAEDGVDPARNTETFAEVALELDLPRWRGTRFVLRAGKALELRRRGVRVHLRPRTDTGLDIDGAFWLDVDDGARAAGAEPVAYRQIIADFLSGGSRFAVGAAEAQLAWDVLTPVLEGWAAGVVPMTTYPAGSAGPPPTVVSN